MLYADLLSLHLATFLMYIILVYVPFFSSRCMLELKLAIYCRAASLPSQASYAIIEYWLKNHWPDQAFFKHSLHTNCISNSAILRNNYVSLLADLCACVHVKNKWHSKQSHSSSVSDLNRLMRLQTQKKVMGWCTAQWKMLLFYAKTILKESCKLELAHLKKKMKVNHFGCLVTFWFGTLRWFLV